MEVKYTAAALLALAALAAPAQAEISNVSPTGFVSNFREEVNAAPDDVWKAIVALPRWWNDQHTWSGRASNMSLELHAGGCWCERWGTGESAQHGQVVLVQEGRVLRLNAGLGPLQELAVNGVLTIVTSAQDGKTFLRMTYRVAGNAEAGLDKLAPVVDQVLGTQYRRLKSLAESGKPQ